MAALLAVVLLAALLSYARWNGEAPFDDSGPNGASSATDAEGGLPSYEGSRGDAVADADGTVEAVAEGVLEAYQEDGDCALAYAGYLDLMGSVWSCVVVGDGWSEICLVSEGGDGDAPQVRVIRIEGEGLEVIEEGG